MAHGSVGAENGKSDYRVVTTCPSCRKPVDPDARVCRHCLHILDRDGWRHDAGRLGPDSRDLGRTPADPGADALPLTEGGMTGGLFGGVLRALGALFLIRPRPRR